VKDFCSAIDKFIEGGQKNLTVDFQNVVKAYPNGMLPVISTLNSLRRDSIRVYIKLPNHDDTRKLFRSVNWAHYLSPDQFEKSESVHDRHLVTRKFETPEQQKNVVNDFMDVVLRSMPIPKDVISGLEWSINEITDNVLNHSESNEGGYIQASTYISTQTIAFAVADSGRGILKSMQEGFPNLRTDLDAIGEAIKAGVTRDPKFGQGNGLAGSLRVSTLTGGSFDITSGSGRLIVTNNESTRKRLYSVYKGTIVCGQIKVDENFSISEALDFDGKVKYIPLNIVDYRYEMDEKDCLLLKMAEETTGFGSRRSGYQIRTKVKNLLNSKFGYPIIIDWSGVPVISSSFADEIIGKLFLEMGAMSFSSLVKNISMEDLVRGLLDKAVAQRLTQAEDEEVNI
jgi:anti-sigma regulatory factor (Ser/Thr protein kinase)